MVSKAPSSWRHAIEVLAPTMGYQLPLPMSASMGVLVWENASGDRRVSLRQSLQKVAEERTKRVTWGFWDEKRRDVVAIIADESCSPTKECVSHYVQLLQGWLTKNLDADTLASKLKDTQLAIETPDTGESKGIESELGEGLRIIIEKDRWQIKYENRSLFRRREGNGVLSEWYSRDSYLSFLNWLASNWDIIAYGLDERPEQIRDAGVSACRSVEKLAWVVNVIEDDTVKWKERHSIRAADPTLPNLFIERQCDELVFSWNSEPAGDISFSIPSGTVVVNAAIAVPQLRELISSNEIGNVTIESELVDEGYRALKAVRPDLEVEQEWLKDQEFDERDAVEFARRGVSRHPVIGLLRSSRGSHLIKSDLEAVLERLKNASADSYKKLLELAQGLDTSIDPSEPWLSGYRLADAVLKRLHFQDTNLVPIEGILGTLDVIVYDISLNDSSVRGVCVGAAGIVPAVFINTGCQEAVGESGRRTTLAHEFCHLLFDRSRMRGLARFEGPHSESDRLLEMRANAFAIELLVPMRYLRDDYGNILSDKQLRKVSEGRKVSMDAIMWHVHNLKRMAGLAS